MNDNEEMMVVEQVNTENAEKGGAGALIGVCGGSAIAGALIALGVKKGVDKIKEHRESKTAATEKREKRGIFKRRKKKEPEVVVIVDEEKPAEK